MKYIYLFIAILITLTAEGQKAKPKNKSFYDDKPIHFGFSLGVNTMDFVSGLSASDYSSDSLFVDVSKLKPGFNIQIISNLRLGRYFDLRFLPGIQFGQRNLTYHRNQTVYDDRQRLESSFLVFPLQLKYKARRLNNVRPYFVAGANVRYDLAAKKEYDEDEPVFVRLKPMDYYLEPGFGVDFYLPQFKFSTELKFCVGLRDVLVHDPAASKPEFVNALEKLKSQIWVISFHFE